MTFLAHLRLITVLTSEGVQPFSVFPNTGSLHPKILPELNPRKNDTS
jgi:hypothetical protein